MAEYVRIRSKDSIPGWVEFSKDPVAFVDRGLERIKLREKYQKVKAERAEIKARPLALVNLKEKLQESYREYHALFIENARKFIEHNRNNANPFDLFQRRAERYRLHNFIPFSIFKQALELLSEADDPTAITEAERTKELRKLEKEMAKIKEQLSEVSPPEDFDLMKGEVNGDKAKNFIDYWRNLQFWTRGAVGLRGLALRYSPEPEMRAYIKLGLDKISNPKAVKFPADP